MATPRAFTSLLTLVTYFSSFVAPQVVAAQATEREVRVAPASSDSIAATREVSAPTTDDKAEVEPTAEESEAPATSEVDQADAERPQTVQALPNGPAKSAVTPQAISLPNAEGSIQGMGESFTPNLSAGTGTFAVPISLPPGRAGVQPSLSLSYSTSGGNGPVGVGWSLAAPFIARQTDQGLPGYVDGPVWHPQEDRFIYNGGQELVPVDTAEAIALDGSTIPEDLAGWQLYRARVEGAFMRFFRSPDGLQWTVQDKNGTRFDFGVLPAGDGPAEMITDSVSSLGSELENGAGRIFSWSLTRMADAHGSTVYYRYIWHDGNNYLADIHYLSPGPTCSLPTPSERRQCGAPLASYGRRVKLHYEQRADVYESYTTTWRTATALRLKRIDITSYDSTPNRRSLVRRYHLRYDPSSFISLLSEVQVEGRPDVLSAGGYYVGDRTVDESSLSDAVVGRLLPPMRFSYSQAPNLGTNVIPGFGGLDATVHQSPASPPVSVSDDRADLFDVNSDGLPDVIVTDPARNRTADGEPAVGVYFNGFSGRDARPGVAGGFSDAIPMGIPPGQSSVLNLGNLNINPMDMDGDGRSDILHMPRLANYGYFSPSRASDLESGYAASPAEQAWEWVKRDVVLSDGDLDPRIDFGRDGARIKVLDVNNDHLIDVVRTTGTQMQTFVNLGYLEGGDGRFGSAEYSGGEWKLSTTPVASCVLHRGLPVDFGDPQIRLADMNGDGLQDIVKIRQGQVVYWPGRGVGVWGAGDPSCESGTADDRDVEMLDAPQEVNVELENVFFSDVNMDGTSDVVQVRFDAIDVWLNVAGSSFTDRIIIDGTPAEPGFANRVRFADIDGSGTTDIVYGDANNWRYVDPMGGQRPRLLIGVENGLGAITTLTYESSTVDYLRDLREAEQCADACCERFLWSRVDGSCDPKFATGCARISGGSPVVTTVVREVATTDQFESLGVGQPDFVKRTEYHYHDAYYEGIEQEFRGFGAADAIEIGDSTHPTSITRTHFDQGRRPGRWATDRLADNPNEALKGRTYLTEVFDLNGTYLSTSHASLTVRELLVGLNDRAVSYAYVHQSDELRYDTGPFVPSSSCERLNLPGVVRQRATGSPTGMSAVQPEEGDEVTRSIAIRSAGHAHIRGTTETVDNIGHVRRQTAHGRVRGEYGEPFAPESIVSHTTPVLCESDEYIWRTEESSVSDGSGSHLSRTTFTYNFDTCDPLDTVVEANLPPEGGFEFGGTNAETIIQASQALESNTLTDQWGNVYRSCGGGRIDEEIGECLRFGGTSFDPEFHAFPVHETVMTTREGSYGAYTSLRFLASWDYGLGVPHTSTDPNDLDTRYTYDGLGRLTSVTPPPPDQQCIWSPKPLVRMSYQLADELSAPVNIVTATTAYDCTSEGEERVSHALVDGLGRTRASLVTAEDAENPFLANRYQRTGLARFTTRGSVAEAFQPDLIPASSDLLPALSLPSTTIPSTFSFYDAFGRVTSAMAEDGSIARSVYHALSTDVWDPNDLDPSSPHYGTPATERQDGHGRGIDQVLRNRHVGRSDVEYYRLWTDYRADGKAVRVTRAQTLSAAPRSLSTIAAGDGPPRVVSRDLIYDTAGRRIASTDPDTDSRSPTRTRANRTWRYLFNRVGDLAAVRDPRGCGQNFYYDLVGRLVAEHYVGCAEAQGGAEVSIVNVPPLAVGMDVGDGAHLDADAIYYFDEFPEWEDESESGFTGIASRPADAAENLRGRATGVLDRGQRSIISYDRLGRAIWSARQMAVMPDEASIASTLTAVAPTIDTNDAQTGNAVVYDVANTYARTASFDYTGRPLEMTVEPFGVEGEGANRRVAGSLTYNARSLPLTASSTVSFEGSSFPDYTRDVVSRIDYTRDGLVAAIQYGADDNDQPGPRSETFYDVRRRPSRMLTYRTPGALAGALATQEDRPLDAVSTVVDQTLLWDRSSNLIELLDGRSGDEWPDGFRPVSYRASHDALYRVAGVELDYTQDSGARTPSDTYVDYRSELEEVRAADPMQPGTAPRVTAAPQGRPSSLTYEYDWLANMVESTDDAQQFHERSLGAITNGFEEEAGRPSALRLATDLERRAPNGPWVPPGGRGGWLEVAYGEGGNVETLTVHAQCGDANYAGGAICYDPQQSVSARAAWLRSSCLCAAEQQYQYRWDELNRLTEARRYDRAGGSGSWELAARQRYRYDAGNTRTAKQVLDVSAGGAAGAPERVALEVFAGDFERRGMARASLNVGAGVVDAYAAAPVGRQEDQYLAAGARMVWRSTVVSPGGQVDADHRVTLALENVLGTAGAVVDLASGDLIEASHFGPHGTRESYRSDAEVGPEPAAFTGKEGEEDVGVTYFGERYLIRAIARWASPDPLSTHGLGGGETGNSYHYVAGSLLQAIDPMGLDVFDNAMAFGRGFASGAVKAAAAVAVVAVVVAAAPVLAPLAAAAAVAGTAYTAYEATTLAMKMVDSGGGSAADWEQAGELIGGTAGGAGAGRAATGLASGIGRMGQTMGRTARSIEKAANGKPKAASTETKAYADEVRGQPKVAGRRPPSVTRMKSPDGTETKAPSSVTGRPAHPPAQERAVLKARSAQHKNSAGCSEQCAMGAAAEKGAPVRGAVQESAKVGGKRHGEFNEPCVQCADTMAIMGVRTHGDPSNAAVGATVGASVAAATNDSE